MHKLPPHDHRIRQRHGVENPAPLEAMRTSLSRTWAKRQNSSPFHINLQTKSLHFLTFYTSSIFVEAQKSHFFQSKTVLKKRFAMEHYVPSLGHKGSILGISHTQKKN